MAAAALARGPVRPVHQRCVGDVVRRYGNTRHTDPLGPMMLLMPSWLTSFIASLTFPPSRGPARSFRSYVVSALPDRPRPPRRLHVNDVKPQQPKGLTTSASHNRQMRVSSSATPAACVHMDSGADRRLDVEAARDRNARGAVTRRAVEQPGPAAAVGQTQPRDRASRPGCSPAEEEPMFAGVELTPTATRWDSATSPTEGRRSATREAEAVTGLQSPAATPWRSTFLPRLLAGLDELRPRPHRPELVVLRHVADRRDPAARPPASPNASHACDVHRAIAATPQEKAPPEWVFLFGLSRRPAHPIELAVVTTMRTGFEVGPPVGWQETHVLGVGAAGQKRAVGRHPPFPTTAGGRSRQCRQSAAPSIPSKHDHVCVGNGRYRRSPDLDHRAVAWPM